MADAGGAKYSPFSVHLLCRWQCLTKRVFHCGVHPVCGNRGTTRMETHCLRAHRSCWCKSIGGGADELARRPVGATAIASASGLFGGNRCGQTHHGGRTSDANEPERN